MRACRGCGFVFNAEFDAARLDYGDGYDNTQDCSPAFDAYLDELVRHLVEERNVRNCRIVEVGCGKGSFLRRLVAREGSGNQGIGFDPSYIGPAQDLGGRLSYEKRFYGPDCTDVRADVVVCRHVIEHVGEPLLLLGAVREALSRSREARVFFETPCVEWILRNRAFWDFFYEHCSLFSFGSFGAAFEFAGFQVREVKRTFGDQYLWLEASLAAATGIPRWQPGTIASLAADYAVEEAQRLRASAAEIQRLARHGRVALWGAGAKGSTFANLIDADGSLIDCVVDLNPGKQGRYIPGSGHPIVGYRELASRNVTDVILMNPNYRAENLALLESAHIGARLIELA
jgi:SAM-dependent methyltransferase